MNINVSLTDTNYFKHYTQSLGLNRSQLKDMNVISETAIPVYTASRYAVALVEEISYLRPLYASKTKPMLSFATNGDGSAGKNFIFHTIPFYINRDRIAFKSLVSDISMKYIWYQLRDMKTLYGFNHNYKANLKNISIVEIELPQKSNSGFDINKQLNIINKWNIYKIFIENISKQVKQFENSFIIPNKNDYIYKTIFLDESVFEYTTTKLGFRKSEYRLLDTKNKSDIPIYTAQLKPVAYIKELPNKQPIMASENNPYISIADDGDGTAGTNIIFHITPFYQNTSRISFRVLCKSILPEYIFYMLQNIKAIYGFNFQYKAKKDNLKLVSVDIPCNENGYYSSDLQNEYIINYKKIKDISNKIISFSNIIQNSTIHIQ